MATDSKYVPVEYLYKSSGLVARDTLDEAPPYSYLLNLNALERAENSMSSRYGTLILNRDPNGTANGRNYWFPSPIISIAKMNYQGYPQRFVGLGDGSLWARNSNSQGAFTELTLPETAQANQITLSGEPFETAISACFETSLPYLFIADADASIKIPAGSTSPDLWGIDPSPYTLNTLPYSPLLTLIDSFSASNSYTENGLASWGWASIETLNANSALLITDFPQFYGISPSGGGAVNYNPSSSSTSATATRGSAGTTTNSAVLSGFASVVPPAGEKVSITFTAGGSVLGGGTFQGSVDFQYSTDGGTTWTTCYSLTEAPGVDVTWPSTLVTTGVSVSNLSQLQVRVQAVATVYPGEPVGVTVAGSISGLYASVFNPNSFGPVVNGMISVLSGNTHVEIPIVSAVTITFGSSPLNKLLQITTGAPHGLASGDYFSVYASSNDIVDGFYNVPVFGVISPTVFNAGFISPSTVSVGATGGYIAYAANSASSYQPIPKACVLTDQYTTPYPSQMSAFGFYQQVPITQSSFPIGAWSGTISASSSTATVNKSVTLDLNQNNEVTDGDLIVLTLLTSNPANIAQIQLQFFVGGSTASSPINYYQALISPAYYQGAIAGNQLAYQATQNQILADALGLISGQTPGTTSAQLQPTNISTGSGSWQTCYIPRGNFLPVGQAGQAGVDWSSVTGWQLTVTTNANGGASFSVNGMYLQWGYGASSFAGVGYDYRMTYYSATTGTESSPCPEQQFNQDFGYLPSAEKPIFLRQAAQLIGQYSQDPQVTHVRIYRRGGILASNWRQVAQFPNLVGNQYNPFYFKDTIGDDFILQAKPLVLDNDPPVTASLVNPIQTQLATSTTLSGLSSIYSLFAPQNVTVNDATAVFVPNQIVEVGNANNLELVMVITGGTGQFSAILRLEHNQGEPVNVYANPRQACNLCCLANLPGGATQMILAGDETNPARVYYAKPNQPENFGPENYLDSPSPNDPVMALINWRGTALVATQSTWYIFVGGAKPYLQPTGAAHGLVASQGWTLAEGVVAFRAADGWRFFSGADGKYMTLPVEWIFRTNPMCLPPQASASNAYLDVFEYFNNVVYGSYISLSGERYRLAYDTAYSRFRQDDIAATAMLWEKDTNLLLCGVPLITASDTLGYALVADQQYNQDYDDGGWNTESNSLVISPVNLNIQTPYRDLGKPHFPKQWNVLETDVNTQGQQLNTTLWFDSGEAAEIVLPSANTGTTRSKVQFQINDGDGEESYSMSIQHTMAVTVAPTLYQENVYAAMLADYRTSFDTYWIKANQDEEKIWKEAYFDYSSTAPVIFSVYADGDMSHPYHQFTLTVQPTRLSVRKLFKAKKCRLWRMVGVSAGNFQLWAPVQVNQKTILEGSGYAHLEFGVYE